MSSPGEATKMVLDERPHLRDTLELIVDLDQDGPWTFEDLDIDSGNFGYLVSKPLVKSVDEGYQLTDREATIAELTTNTESYSTESSIRDFVATSSNLRDKLQFASPLFLIALTLSLWILVLTRSLIYQTVFRENHVMLPGNDPWHYRYWVDQLLAADFGVFAFSDIATHLGGRNEGEPLTYTIGWWLTVLFESNPETSGVTVALLPLLSTLIVGLLVAWMAHTVTNDERITVLAVLALAINPSHGLYSGIGFFDHHTIDYVWVSVMAAALVWLGLLQHKTNSDSDFLRHPHTWIATMVFGISTVSAMLSWNGAPLLLLGVAFYAVFHAASVVRIPHSPTLTSIPLMSGLLLATGIGHLMHTRAGWQEPLAIYAPLIVLVGVIGVTLLSEVVDRTYAHPGIVFGIAGLTGVGVIVGLYQLAPDLYDRLYIRITNHLFGREWIAESRLLISTDMSLLFGPVDHHGWWVFFAIPALVVVALSLREQHDPMWLVLAGFFVSFFLLALRQVRFAGELSPFASIFAAVGIIWAFSRVNLVNELRCFTPRQPRRFTLRATDRTINQTVYLSFGLVLIFAIGFIITAGVAGTVAIDDEEYEAAVFIEGHADTHDDEDFVLSRWGRNRMYNYIVWGGGDTYGYADRNYEPFLNSHEPDEWYQDDFQNRVGYLVIENLHIDSDVVERRTTYAQLFLFNGSATTETDGVGHYQLLHRTETNQQAIYQLVPGAVIDGTTDPNEELLVRTEVELDSGSFTYIRRTTANETGDYAVRVGYPGEYETSDGEMVTITDTDIAAGNTIRH